MSESSDIADIAIVIPVFNQLHYTRQCVESLNRAGIADSQIIIINNGSTDGTREFLEAQPSLRTIHNEVNRGCGGAWSQGSQLAQATWTVLLNNDVLVPLDFFPGLKNFAVENKMDVVSPAMCEGEGDYDWQTYAAEFTQKMCGVRRNRIAHGVCFMVHRRVFETIGYFDDDMKLGGYEDDEFFRRARRAGFQLATTGAAFLHHFGMVTQKSMKSEQVMAKVLARRAYYRKKSGQTWLSRKFIQQRDRFRGWRWRTTEKKSFGHTLKERRVAGNWEFY
jgi:N-acetylglucosaminyl-diphospho-decaprenol L-rhamnosyltransferase